ncbi:MAG: hypothetical protein ACIAQF_10675 [Phycisphaerales bacterium JB065]
MAVSFEEKSVWVQFVATTVALATYVWIAAAMYMRGVDRLEPYTAVFAVSVVWLVVILIVGHIIAAVTGRQEDADERDRLIGWRSESNSSWVLGLGVFAALACLVGSVPEVLTAHVLLLSLYASQMMQYGFQILYYRRGM